MRLDIALTSQTGIKSRAFSQRLIDDGRVRVNGKKARKASMEVSTSDVIEWDAPPTITPSAQQVSNVNLDILFEDDHCMVIHKPAGLTVHPGHGSKHDEETVLSALKPMFAKRKIAFSEGEVLVHRLDKETTGCLLIAKTPAAHLMLQNQFANRTVDKRYLAVVDGIPEPPAAIIDAPIGRHASQRTRMSVHQATGSRPARTTYRLLSSSKEASLLECELHTGRTHQIRVHLRSIEHPILGDGTYATNSSRQRSEKFSLAHLCLHAWKLRFRSPSKKEINVTCPPPDTFFETMKTLDIDCLKVLTADR